MESNHSTQNKSLGFKFSLALGTVGFLAGFIGPMILAPDSNQGPMLGIFITGPGGFVLGLGLWFLSAMFSWSFKTQQTLLRVASGAIVVGVVAAVFWPKPNWVGWLYEVEVVSCRAPSADTESVIEDWKKRTTSANWLSPREGWQDEVRKILADDQGSVIEARVLTEKNVKKEKPFLKSETYVAYALTFKESRVQSFYVSSACHDLPVGFRRTYFVPLDYMHITADQNRPWPPRASSDLLVKATLLPVPEEMKGL